MRLAKIYRGPFGGLAGAVGGMLLGSSGSGSKHTGDGRVGAGERPHLCQKPGNLQVASGIRMHATKRPSGWQEPRKEGMMKDALGSTGPAGAMAGGALNTFGAWSH